MRPAVGLVGRAVLVRIGRRVVLEAVVVVLARLVLAVGTVGARLDVGRDVLPVVDGRLGHPREVVGRLHVLEDAGRLDLPTTVGGGPDPHVDALATDRGDLEGRVLTLHTGRDALIRRVAEAGVPQEGSRLFDLGGLHGGDRLERPEERERGHDPGEGGRDHDDRQGDHGEDPVPVQPGLSSDAVTASVLHCCSSMSGYARDSSVPATSRRQLQAGLNSSLPFKLAGLTWTVSWNILK